MMKFEGESIDATIKQEAPNTITLAARGGGGLNTQYADGLFVILGVLWAHDAVIDCIEVTSRPAMKLPKRDRRVTVFADATSIPLADVPEENIDKVRRAISKGVANHGRAPNAKGSGNGTKKITLYYTSNLPVDWSEYQGGES